MKFDYKVFDRLLRTVIEKYLFEISMGLLVLLSIMIRVHLAPVCVLSPDYKNYFLPWVEEYRRLGAIGGLAQTIGDYYVPYNIMLALMSVLPWEPYALIAFTSCLAEYIGAFYIYKIVVLILQSRNAEYIREKAAGIAILTLYFPMAILNGALWKQSDAIYACFVIVSIYFLILKKHTRAFIFLALGFCFKLQVIFALPIFIIAYVIWGEFSIFQFLWIPGMYVLTGIPAILCGRPVKATYKVYLGQVAEYGGMSINTPNIYNFGLTDYPALSKPAIMTTIAILIAITVYCYKVKERIDFQKFIYLSAWVIWTCFMFLPGMHERYDYAAIVLISAYVLARRRKLLYIPIILNLCSTMTYSNYLFGAGVPYMVYTIPYCAAYFATTIDLLLELKRKRVE